MIVSGMKEEVKAQMAHEKPKPWYVEWQAGRIDALLAENIRLGNEFAAKIGTPETF